MVLTCIRIRPSPNRRPETIELLRSIQGPILAATGCLACTVAEEQNDEPAIIFAEEWEGSETFEKHVRSALFARLLAALELSSSPPELRIHQVSETNGLDLISRLRGSERSVVAGGQEPS